jgi:hypothetical protein
MGKRDRRDVKDFTSQLDENLAALRIFRQKTGMSMKDNYIIKHLRGEK